MKKLLGFSSSTLSVAIINLISLMILTRLFTPADYGKANLLISYAVVISTIVSFAVDQVLIHFYYRVSLKSILTNYFKYSIIISVILGTILFFISSSISFNKIDIFLTIFYSIALVNNKVFLTLFRMNNDAQNYFIQTSLSKVIELTLIISFVYTFSEDYQTLLFPFIVSVILVSIFQLKSISNIIKSSLYKEQINIREQITFSFPMLFSILLTTLTQNVDKFVVSQFVSNKEMGYYYTSFKLIGIISIVYTVISLVWVPKAVKISDSEEERDTYYYEITSQIFQIIACCIIIFYLLFKDLIIEVLGNDFGGSSHLLDILMIIPIVMIMSEVYSTFITIKRKTSYHLFISIIILVVNSLASYILSMVWGVYGAAYSLFLTYLAIYICRLLFFKKISHQHKKIKVADVTGFIILIFLLMNSLLHIKWITIILTVILLNFLIMFSRHQFKYFMKSIL